VQNFDAELRAINSRMSNSRALNSNKVPKCKAPKCITLMYNSECISLMKSTLSKTTRGYMKVSSLEVEGCDGNVNS